MMVESSCLQQQTQNRGEQRNWWPWFCLCRERSAKDPATGGRSFSSNLAFVFVGLALLYGTVRQLHGFCAFGLVASTFVGLIFVALRELQRKRQEQPTNNSQLKIDPPPTYIQV
jgi:hypothetical protein